jgi:hypothetical protein
MSETPHRTDGGRESAVMIIITLAAYIGFAAFTMLHDGGLRGGGAQAGVPVDAVRAAARANGADGGPVSDRPTAEATSRQTPAYGVGRIIPDPSSAASDLRGNLVPQSRDPGGANIEEVGPAGPGGQLQFLVKFEDAEAAEWWGRFQANPGETREAFSDFARGSAPFTGLRLLNMSPSGVATLELEGAAPSAPAAAQELADDIVSRLSGADGVEYAEPNLVAAREEIQ